MGPHDIWIQIDRRIHATIEQMLVDYLGGIVSGGRVRAGSISGTLPGKVWNPMTTLGDLIYGAASGLATRLAGNTTTTRKFLRQTGTGTASAAPAWDALAADDYPTMVGDSGSGGTKGAVPAPATGDAAAGKFLKADGTFAVPPGGLTNPMTTQDDIIVGDATGAPARLAKGADSQVLTVDPTTHHLIWAASPSGFADPTTTKGDLIVHGTSTTRLPVGTDGYVLEAASTEAAGVKWAAKGGGSDFLVVQVFN